MKFPITPYCPKCKGTNGSLGTQYAYFMCKDCGTCTYWTKDYQHPGDFALSVARSPFAQMSKLSNGT